MDVKVILPLVILSSQIASAQLVTESFGSGANAFSMDFVTIGNPGWQTCSLAMRLTVDHFLRDSESFGSPGLAYLKWRAPVRPNDELTLKATVLEKRFSARNSMIGVLRWRWQVRNQESFEVS